jgi:hypothetical protein
MSFLLSFFMIVALRIRPLAEEGDWKPRVRAKSLIPIRL